MLEIREGDAVSIKQIENSIIDRAWEQGWVKPQPPKRETGHRVAVVGSGPAGMAAAQQLRRAGHARDAVRARRVRRRPRAASACRTSRSRSTSCSGASTSSPPRASSVRCGVDVGVDISADELREDFDAVVLATGSRTPRDLPVPGRDLEGIHFAMEYLSDRNRWVATQTGTPTGSEPPALLGLTAEGKHVVVIGGGDTGADCVGNSLRQGAASITQLELLPEPPPKRPDDRTPWPLWPQKFRLSYAMEEAQDGRASASRTSRSSRRTSPATTTATCARCTTRRPTPAPPFKPVAGHRGRAARPTSCCSRWASCIPSRTCSTQLGVAKDERGNAKADQAVHDLRRRRLRRRRRAPRPVAHRVGDQRGPPVRADGRSLPRRRSRAAPAADADADDGPPGPPQHVGPGVPA